MTTRFKIRLDALDKRRIVIVRVAEEDFHRPLFGAQNYFIAQSNDDR
jgi:hypothetical protein